MAESSADYREIFDHFKARDVPDRSCYAWAPVFPCRVGDRKVVLKQTRGQTETAAAVAGWTAALAEAGVAVVSPVQTSMPNPVAFDDRFWVVYPFIEGVVYDGGIDQAAAAGELLGRIHDTQTSVTPPPFEWPDHDEESVAEDLAGIARVLTGPVPAAVEPLSRLITEFMPRILPAIRDARLPMVGAVMDYKANNLVYPPDGEPVLVDPDNADWAPRILDLALAAMQFHIEHPAAPARMFDAQEWNAFISGYLNQVTLTSAERRLWPVALEYMLCEYGVWSLIESDEWGQTRERAFMIDMAQTDADRFRLP